MAQSDYPILTAKIARARKNIWKSKIYLKAFIL